jgi:hypothetical protein
MLLLQSGLPAHVCGKQQVKRAVIRIFIAASPGLPDVLKDSLFLIIP